MLNFHCFINDLYSFQTDNEDSQTSGNSSDSSSDDPDYIPPPDDLIPPILPSSLVLTSPLPTTVDQSESSSQVMLATLVQAMVELLERWCLRGMFKLIKQNS